MNLQDLKFNDDWTTHNTEIWRTHLRPLIHKPGVLGLEIGTWEGRSTAWFLENIVTGTSASLITVDRDHSRFAENRELLIGKFGGSRLLPVTMDAFDFLIQRIAENRDLFDFIYLDGPKDAGDLIDQAALCWKVLKPGGVLIFDDYLWPGQGPSQFHNLPRHYANPPRIGIDAFMQTHYLAFDLLHKGWQIIIRKK